MFGAADKREDEALAGRRTEPLPALLAEIRAVVDARAIPPTAWDSVLRAAANPPPIQPLVALVGHRTAGKSRLLPLICRWTGRPGVDLDRLVEERAGRSIRELFSTDREGFRTAEREAFASIRGPAVVATGGGFLSLHADLLRGHTAVLVPITFDAYRERLMAESVPAGSPARPRLRPELSLEDEIAQVFTEREALHGAARTTPLLDFLRATAASAPWR